MLRLHRCRLDGAVVPARRVDISAIVSLHGRDWFAMVASEATVGLWGNYWLSPTSRAVLPIKVAESVESSGWTTRLTNCQSLIRVGVGGTYDLLIPLFHDVALILFPTLNHHVGRLNLVQLYHTVVTHHPLLILITLTRLQDERR